MKKSPLLMIALAVLLTSCGTAANLASSSGEARFQDGIYSSSPSFISKAEKDESQAKTDALIEETKASRIYLFGDRKDTVMIPENMSASIRYDKSLASTIVTVEENPYSWMNNIDPWYYYTPYSIGSAWYWSRHYDPWYSSAWRWNTWAYSPWRYYGWYDPFYIGGWYDPWYYGYAGIYGGWYGGWYGGCHHGWYDPWYHHHHHHHYHPDPVVHKEDRWYGSRHQTGSERIFTSGTSSRGGIATSSRTSRTSSASAAGRTSVTTSSSQRTSSKVSTTPTRVSTSQKSTTYRRPAGTTNYRKPASGSTGSSTGRSAATYRNSTSETSRSSATYRSYNSGAGSGSTRSSYSTGGASRSSYSGGGSRYSGGGSGASRSSRSSGARR